MLVKMMSTPVPGIPPPPVKSKTPSAVPVVSPIPGGYGFPLVGPLLDRLDYFWFQGPETFFKKRIEKHKSTVFRTNVPPTFAGVNPNVVAVLDCKSFSHLFDMDIVEKKNVLVGDFMPSVAYTGDLRVCAYLDTSEPKHAQVKNFTMDILKRSSKTWVPTLISKLDTMWDSIETALSKSGSAAYLDPLQRFLFSFFCLTLAGADVAASPKISKSGHTDINIWLALQLLPTVPINVVQPLEEIFLHAFPYPAALVSGVYNRLADFIEQEGKETIQRGEDEFGLSRDEAIHNLLFTIGFNAFGGFSIFLPYIFSKLGQDTTGMQQKLREEVRAKAPIGSTVSFDSVKEMELVQSFVYEALRLSPPVPQQFARARKDFLLSSHDSVYQIKKGELLCGYQPQVMRDPKVFEDPDKFIIDRFTKEKGKELLNYLYWSNGPQTGTPSESNKQCAAKDLVTLTTSLLIAHLFQRHDSFTTNSSGKITALQKAKRAQ